jgi:ribosomal protein S21
MSDQEKPKKTIILPENVSVDYEFEKKLKIFLKKSQDIIREVKERRYYIKPSEIRHKLIGSIERKRKLEKRKKRRK